MGRSILVLALLGILVLGSSNPLAAQTANRGGLWCGEEHTLPTERPTLENAEALNVLGERLVELFKGGRPPARLLFFRNEAGEARPLEGVVEVDVWFCVDPSGTVTQTRVSGLGTRSDIDILTPPLPYGSNPRCETEYRRPA